MGVHQDFLFSDSYRYPVWPLRGSAYSALSSTRLLPAVSEFCSLPPGARGPSRQLSFSNLLWTQTVRGKFPTGVALNSVPQKVGVCFRCSVQFLRWTPRHRQGHGHFVSSREK